MSVGMFRNVRDEIYETSNNVNEYILSLAESYSATVTPAASLDSY